MSLSSVRGFSLVEMLLVLLVIGLGGSIAMLSLGQKSDEQRLLDSADEFARATRYAIDDAVMGGEPLGLILVSAENSNSLSYYWARYRDQLWLPREDAVAVGNLVDDVALQLEVEGQPVNLPQYLSQPKTVPVAVIYPSLEATPMRVYLSLTDGAARQQIDLSDLAVVTVVEAESP